MQKTNDKFGSFGKIEYNMYWEVFWWISTHPVVIASICSNLILATCNTLCIPGIDPPNNGCNGLANAPWLPDPHSCASNGSIPLETARQTSTGWYFTLRANTVIRSNLCCAPTNKKIIRTYKEMYIFSQQSGYSCEINILMLVRKLYLVGAVLHVNKKKY